MNEDRLTTLLAERADGASRVHPTRDGVEAVVAQRARRRHRHRIVGSAAAVVLVVGGAVGGIALSRSEDAAAPADDPEPLPEVPAVGLELEGFLQRGLQIGDLDTGEGPGMTVTIFRSGEALSDPFLGVLVEPPSDDQVPTEDRGQPVDLDGDGTDDGHIERASGATAITWDLDDGSIAGVAAYGVPEAGALRYAGELFGPTLAIGDLPAPDGLPQRSTWALPDRRGPDQARVAYDEGEGTDRAITVTTTNQPGYFDLLQASTWSLFGGSPYEEIPLGPSFLGPGRAILRSPGEAQAYALVITDAGLTIEIVGENVDAAIIRTAIESGAFAELEPRGGRN